VFFTFPTKENTFVPLPFSVPIALNHSLPLFIISGIFAQVSTLFSTVGIPHKPFSVECMYFALGSPTFPSIEAMRAVDSPHTKAPPPLTILILKLIPLPNMSVPRKPCLRASSIALCIFLRASSYSSLI
jgi:hypothetical protein